MAVACTAQEVPNDKKSHARVSSFAHGVFLYLTIHIWSGFIQLQCKMDCVYEKGVRRELCRRQHMSTARTAAILLRLVLEFTDCGQ